MMRLAEAMLFLGLAAAAHLGLWHQWPERSGGGHGGDGGAASVTLAAATPDMQAMVTRWKAGPEAQTDVRAPVAASAMPKATLPVPLPHSVAMRLPTTPAIPSDEVALPKPPSQAAPMPTHVTHVTQPLAPAPDAGRPAQPTTQADTLPRPDTASHLAAIPWTTSKRETVPQVPKRSDAPHTPQPTMPAAPAAMALPEANTSSTPAMRRPPPSRPVRQAEAAPASRAKGARAKTPVTNRVADQAASKKPASTGTGRETSALRATWGARITARLYRAVARSGTPGSIGLTLSVAPSGKLQSVAVHRSSGNAAFDRDALRAVRRINRFDPAPDGLTQASYPYRVTLTLKR